jgi:hypothetical protein
MEMIETVFGKPLEVVWDYEVGKFEEAVTVIKRVV